MTPATSERMDAAVARARFAGVLSILQYNRHFYVASLGGLLGVAAILRFGSLPRAVAALLVAGAALAAFWSIGSLAASYSIYDYAGVTRWEWLPQALSFPPRRWLNIHAGLDESTPALARFFPGSDFAVLDIYDPREMTEPSIARARELHASDIPALAARLDALPLPDGDRDTVFLLFAAHEVRDHARRVQFLREVVRVLSPNGQVLLVEHMRDWPNFIAFGPGFLHFHARRDWLRVAESACLRVVNETRQTPFVRCFLLRRSEG